MKQFRGTFRPAFVTTAGQHTLLNGDLQSLAPVTTRPTTGLIQVPKTARNVHILMVGRGADAATPPAAFAFHVLSLETLTGPAGKTKRIPSIVPLYFPLVLAQGTATFGSVVLNGVGTTADAARAFLSEIDFIADQIATTVLIGESSVLSPGTARPAVLSLDCRGAQYLTFGIDSPATGGNLLYRFW